LIQQSFAAEGSACSSFMETQNSNQADPSALKNLWECTKGFGGGVWDSTGGAVYSLGKAVVDVTNGVITAIINAKETYQGAVDIFSKIPNFMANIENSFGTMKVAFQSLPQEVKIKIGCELIASVGTGALIAFFTAGAGSPVLLRAIVKAIAKVLSYMPTKAPGAGKMEDLAKELLKQAEATEKRVDKIKKTEKENAVWTYEEAARQPPQVKNTGGQTVAPTSAALRAVYGIEGELADFLKNMRSNGQGVQADHIEANIKAMAAHESARAHRKATEKYLKDLKESNKLSAEDKAFLAAYFAGAGCSMISSINPGKTEPSFQSEGASP
jgi:hypothetical protein